MNREFLTGAAWVVLGLLWMIFKTVALTAITIIAVFGIIYFFSPPERRLRLRDGWMRVAQKIGHFNSNVFLGLFYWTVVTPYGLVMMIFGDPLRMKSRHTWINRSTRDLALRDARKQS